MYSLEFLCLSLCKLMVLERMRDFASQRTGDDGARGTRRLAVAVKAVLWGVTAANAAGVIASAVAAGYYTSASTFYSQAAAACDDTACFSNTTALTLQQSAVTALQTGFAALAFQNFCESGSLFVIICAFGVVGSISARRFKTGRRDMNAAVQHLRRQIVVTVAVVLVTFMLRAVFAFLLAVADGFQNDSSEDGCGNDFCDPACNNAFSIIQTWLMYCSAPCSIASQVCEITLLLQVHPGAAALRQCGFLPPGAACCAVGNDQRAHSAADVNGAVKVCSIASGNAPVVIRRQQQQHAFVHRSNAIGFRSRLKLNNVG